MFRLTEEELLTATRASYEEHRKKYPGFLSWELLGEEARLVVIDSHRIAFAAAAALGENLNV